MFIASFAFVLRHGENKCNRAKPIPILRKDKGDNISKNRTEILTFRVTPEEKNLIETKAYSSYRLVSMYLRDCALDKEIIVIDGIKDVANELRRIGNNLNQITKAVNSGVYAVDLTETKKEVQKVWQSLNSLPRAVR
ncbi:MAG: MobC family plasmid mobilization relaxosome protein [Eubacterium sp.]|nr:MobC family plasmid mobilization relaxosome protein [Eubacterium sp.]